MLQAEGVSLRRGSRTVLSDVSLHVQPGAMMVIVGPNGAGKSSLLKLLCGSLSPSSGTVMFLGRPMAEWNPVALARHRAVLSQSVNVSFPFSVAEIVELPLQDLPPQQRREISMKALAEVGLPGFGARQVQQLSGGEQQRVHLARVLSQLSAHRPPHFLFLDEPTSSLDVRHQVDVLRLVKSRVSERSGVILVLHDLNLAAAFADRLLIMKDGRIVADGPPGAVMSGELLSSIYGVGITKIEPDGRKLFFPELGLTSISGQPGTG